MSIQDSVNRRSVSSSWNDPNTFTGGGEEDLLGGRGQKKRETADSRQVAKGV